MNYSKWDAWVPTDEATKEEEEKLNREFETNNPEFCAQFVKDTEERKKNIQKKQENSDNIRLKGNRYFKAKDYTSALEKYMEALKILPFDTKTLLNIAQCHLKLNNYEDGHEFLSRTLYLDPKNIKALSRLAFVLAEEGLHSNALETINKALLLDPMNPELITQQREIHVIHNEKVIEEKYMSSLQVSSSKNEITNQEASLSINQQPFETKEELNKSSSTNPTELIDLIHQKLSVFMTKPTETIDSSPIYYTTVQETTPLLLELLSYWKETQVSNPETIQFLQLYIQKNNTLSLLFNCLQYYHTHVFVSQHEVLCYQNAYQTLTKDKQLIIYKESYFFILLIQWLSKLLSQQRQIQQLYVQDKIYIMIKSMLTTLLSDISNHSLELTSYSYQLLLEIILQIEGLCWKELLTHKTQHILIYDTSLFVCLTSLLGNYALSLPLLQQKFSTCLTMALQTFDALLNIFVFYFYANKELQLTKSSSTSFTNTMAQMTFIGIQSTQLFVFCCSIGSLLETSLFLLTNKTTEQDQQATWMSSKSFLQQQKEFLLKWEKIWDHSIELLLDLSQIEDIRSYFAIALPLTFQSNSITDNNIQSSATKDSTITLLHILIRWIKYYQSYEHNLIAILMNLSIAPSTSTTNEASNINVREIIYQAGGLSIALSGLHVNETQRDRITALTWSRKAGLLSRLATIEGVQQQLCQEENYRLICQRIHHLSQLSSTNKDIQDELLHYIRVLAALPTPSNKLKEIAIQAHIIDSLLTIFPTPRKECGEITPLSVTLMPLEPVNPIAIGNAARCFMPYADDPNYGKELYQKSDRMTIAKWICAMATCTDIRIRKNIAILLAKACRIPGIRDQVSHLRGLQMMIELQDKL